MVFDVVIILLLLVCSAFFSGSETALTAISRARIHRLSTKGNKRATTVLKLKEKKEELIGAILLGNNLVNIAATAIATSVAIRTFGDDGVFVATLVLTFLILIFAEVLPKTMAIRSTERMALLVAPVLEVLVALLAPITRSVNWFIRKCLAVFGVDFDGNDALVEASDIIRGTIELHHSEGGMVKADKDMLGSVLDLANIEVGEIMEHRKHIETINMDNPVKEKIHQALNSPHRRLPLWRDTPDNIIGLLHVRDLLKLLAQYEIKDITREMFADMLTAPWFIPETTMLREQLMAFRQQQRHFAHVVDEYGDFQGIVTLEDIVEEIVGEIRDEQGADEEGDAQKEVIVQKPDGSYIVNAMVSIRDLNRKLDWDLPDDNAATVGGLVIHEARSIPEKGARFVFYEYQFNIIKKRANQLVELQIRKMKQT